MVGTHKEGLKMAYWVLGSSACFFNPANRIYLVKNEKQFYHGCVKSKRVLFVFAGEIHSFANTAGGGGA